ncbi:MAG TPA: serine hydrolase domain-containing protein [Thermodesulfobacteriota bacterium]|nr:serine hydrolase domain-containing protein [Thermodesulfobacteriota bacterium]
MRSSLSHRTRLSIGIMATFILLLGCASLPQKAGMPQANYAHTRDALTSLVQGEMKRHNLQGMSIALVDDQRIVWTQGFGYADAMNRIPAHPETIYPAGSIAKLFTITAALQLAEQNKIEIDQPLRAYLPEFSVKTRFPDSAPITVRSLLTHHSGLPSDHLKEMIHRNPMPLPEMLKELSETWVASPPNFVFSYSNVAIQLLGYLVERTSGKDFATYMDESVFRPMGMNHTSFVIEPGMRPHLSKGYKGGQESEEILLHPIPSPDGPIYTSVVDLSRFIQMIFARGRARQTQILKSETLSEALLPQNSHVPLDFDFQIGLGWFLNEPDIRNVGLVASHGGTLSLFHSQLIILPDHKLGVVVLANSSGAVHVVNRIAEEALKLALEEKTGIHQPEPGKSVEEPVIPWPQTALKDYAGHYATGLRVFTVEAKNGKLYSRLMGRRVQLALHPGGQFSLRYRLLGLIRIKLGELEKLKFSLVTLQGRKVLVLHHKGKRYLLGEKVEASPVPEVWLKRTGEYGLVDAENYLPVIEKAQLKYEDSFLMLEVKIPILGDYGIERLKFAIHPISDTEAILLGLGRNMGETIQVVNDHGVERLRYSGCEFIRKSDQ